MAKIFFSSQGFKTLPKASQGFTRPSQGFTFVGKKGGGLGSRRFGIPRQNCRPDVVMRSITDGNEPWGTGLWAPLERELTCSD